MRPSIDRIPAKKCTIETIQKRIWKHQVQLRIVQVHHVKLYALRVPLNWLGRAQLAVTNLFLQRNKLVSSALPTTMHPSVCSCADTMEPFWRIVFDEYSDDEDSKWWKRRQNQREKLRKSDSLMRNVEHAVDNVGVPEEPPVRRRSYFRRHQERSQRADGTLWFQTDSWDEEAPRRRGLSLRRTKSKIRANSLEGRDDMTNNKGAPARGQRAKSVRRSSVSDDRDARSVRSRSRITRPTTTVVETFTPVVEEPKQSFSGWYFPSAPQKELPSDENPVSVTMDQPPPKRKTIFNRGGKTTDETPGHEGQVRRGRSRFRIAS